MTCDSHGARFRRVMKLTVTAFLPDLCPLILLGDANRVPDLHRTSLSGRRDRIRLQQCKV